MTAINSYFNKTTSAAPLAVFRICFGLMMLFSILRFWANGWIKSLYINPSYFFSYYGFEFVKPLGNYTYLLFVICAISSLFVALGFLYRYASLSLFVSFTYIELMDKSTYLNHYYFISLVCFLLVFLPANCYFSLDANRKEKYASKLIPQWNIDSLKLMMAILYFYAGLAKLNSDWLLHALPLKIWLPARNDMPIIGPIFNYTSTAYLFSWLGCLYDLSIPFLLWNKTTRPFAYATVIIFHALTALLFPIGMFPHIMMVAALVFFSPNFHSRILSFISKWVRFEPNAVAENSLAKNPSFVKPLFVLFFMVQLLFPFRYLAYPGELFWTEEGYRFSWRVMLMEKAGSIQFTVKDSNGNFEIVNPKDYLSPLQEKMMATQPDMILQFAHHLRNKYQELGYSNPSVYADSYVTLNGRLGKQFINPNTDLAKEEESFAHKDWIKPFTDEITGF
jgi:hypothetical protein